MAEAVSAVGLGLALNSVQLSGESRRQYSVLFQTPADLATSRQAAREQLKSGPAFKAQLRATADAVNAEREYLYDADPELRQLHAILWR